MARKSTKIVKAIIDRHAEAVKHYTKVIEAKERGDENPIYRNKSVDHLEAIATGQAIMLETVLFESGCYHGFKYVDKLMRGPIKPEHPDYRDWRRVYLIKE